MILRTLLAHYRRHPVQAAFLLAGIVMAHVLLVGTQLINAQARSSYAEGEQLLGAGPVAQLRPTQGQSVLDEREYIALRRAGFHEIVPLLRRLLRLDNGRSVEVLGVDALAMPRNGAVGDAGALRGGFAFSPWETWAAPARLTQLGWQAGDQPRLEGGETLPSLVPVEGAGLGHRLLMDIGALQALSDSPGVLSSVLVYTRDPDRLAALQDALPAGWTWVATDDQPDPAELTRSFHLNLAAMGLLAFVVGLFLVYNALSFSLTDRRDVLRKLRLAGVTRRELSRALVLELGIFLVLGALIGSWLGAWLAARLLPGVGQTLAQLYGAYITYPDSWAPAGLWWPVAMTLLAGGLCLAWPLRRVLSAPLLQRKSSAWRSADARKRDAWLLLAALVMLGLSAGIAVLATNTWLALGGMACLLLGAAFSLPMVLRGLLDLVGRAVSPRQARWRWLVADSRWLLGPAAVALMAMTLALVANAGLNSMISSFRQATDTWLAQRLVAELYLREPLALAELEPWLAEAAPGVRVGERRLRDARVRGANGLERWVQVADLVDDPRYTDSVVLVRAETRAEQRFAAGEGVYVSERAWRLDGDGVGDTVFACDREWPVLGVYHDYGNPKSQWMMSQGLYESCWPGQPASGQALYGPDSTDWGELAQALQQAWHLDDTALVDQRALRAAGLRVFDRTFTVTQALNALTLLVAGIGIFCAVSAIHHHRVGQQALLASLGLSRRDRAVLLLGQWGMLGLLCMVLVGPFGAALAAYLAGVVTPASFGWSFPLVVQPWQWLSLAGVAAVSFALAVVLPSTRLLRVSPALLLREQGL